MMHVHRLISLVRPPVFEDEEKTRQARLAYLVAWLFATLPLLFALAIGYTAGPAAPLLVTLPLVGVSLLSLGLLYLIANGKVTSACFILVVVIWISAAVISRNLGGIRDASYAINVMVIVLAGLLLGSRAGVAVAVLSLVLGWGLAEAEVNNALPVDNDTPYDILTNYTAIFFATAGLIASSNRGFRALLSRIRENEHDLRARNWELRQMQTTLEERVVERTADLNRRSRYLQAAARVAYTAGEILDVEELMAEAVELIREAFDLYYVGLFTVDDVGEWAVLRAGTGEAGRRMLARSHQIRVGEGMVGWAVERGESRFAQQAEADRVRLVAAELPETQAEAALPLRARGRVLGALTVQSSAPDFFDEATVTVLQTMADLLAIALSNAELYAESERAMAAARRAYGEVAAEVWGQLLRARGSWGYRYSNGMVRPTDEAWQPATTKAISSSQPIRSADGAVSSVAVPLQVGNKVIGAINYQRRADEGEWQPDDISLLTAMADQLAQALDSARLLQETQRQAAREQQINDIVTALTNTLDAEVMLQTTARALGGLPGVVAAAVHVAPATPDAEEAVGGGAGEAWREFVRNHPNALDYVFRPETGVVPAMARYPEVEQVLSQNTHVVTQLISSEVTDGAATTPDEARTGLAVPVRLRDRRLGVLNLRLADAHVPPETVQMVGQIADRLAVSLESTRLLEETRRTALEQQMVGHVTRRMRETLSVDYVLQTAVRELREVLELETVEIRVEAGHNGHNAGSDAASNAPGVGGDGSDDV